MESFYRTGQAAKALNLSVGDVRRLCESELIRGAVRTKGNQWRVPVAEVERLKVAGVPPVPVAPTEPGEPEDESEEVDQADDTDPFDEPVGPPTPAVQEAFDSVRISEARLRRRRVDLELEEVEDRFRDRARKDAEQREAEQLRLAEAAEQRKAQVWRDQTRSQVLAAIPAEYPVSVRIEADRFITQALAGLLPSTDPQIVVNVIAAAVAEAVKPYRAAQERERLAQQRAAQAEREGRESAWAIEAALQFAPWNGRKEAEQAARTAVDRLPAGASYSDKERAARAAVDPIAAAHCQQEQSAQKQRDAEYEADWALIEVASILDDRYEFDDLWERIQTEQRVKRKLRPLLVERLLLGPVPKPELSCFVRQQVRAELETDSEE